MVACPLLIAVDELQLAHTRRAFALGIEAAVAHAHELLPLALLVRAHLPALALLTVAPHAAAALDGGQLLQLLVLEHLRARVRARVRVRIRVRMRVRVSAG